MAEVLKEILCKPVRNSKHKKDITLQHRDVQVLRDGQRSELSMSWLAAKEKWRSAQDFFSIVDVLLDNNAGVKRVWDFSGQRWLEHL